MTLYTVSQAIRNVGGQVILCGNQPFGYVIRAQVGSRICCIVMPSGKQPAQYPFERDALTHIVSTASLLQNWLTSLELLPTSRKQD